MTTGDGVTLRDLQSGPGPGPGPAGTGTGTGTGTKTFLELVPVIIIKLL